ncbi:MAG: PSD1 and planctomycete cytochrome C domain-containing protein [Verrucomicrobiales bacterium]
MNIYTCIIIMLCAGVGALSALAADSDPGKMVFFEKSIRPLLAEHCYKCHSESKGENKGGLTLDTQSGWMDGGDSGPALVPGKISESLLIEAVEQRDPDFAMPPKYKLSGPEITRLKEWVAMGAPDPRDGKPAKLAPSSIDIAAGRGFWSFRPVKSPPVPVVKNGDWPSDPIDRFILAKQVGKGVSPVADADRATLIRRATYDLVGLPPTPAEIRAFINDPAGDRQALARVVDRLLASGHFGERWGRHWLDIVRYGESMGRTRNYPFPFAWKYRDYVIASFNKDKPYDRFVTEQLAGDLLPAKDNRQSDEHHIATGFLALGSMDLNERDREKFKLDVIDDQIDVTGRAFMALTTGCARCHDHKFDPIPTADYYAMAGIFGSTNTLSGYGNRQGGGNKLNRSTLISLSDKEGKQPAVVEAPRPGGKEMKLQKQLDNLKREESKLVEGLKEFRKAGQDGKKRISGINPATQFSPHRAQQRIKQIKGQVKRFQKQISNLANARKGAGATNGNLAMGVRDAQKISNCRVRIRGDVDNRGAEVARGVPRVLTNGKQPQLPPDSSGRLELARWMSDPSHPLTARVMVNRVWHHLFGSGIVRTVDNFGESGERPSHPQLLDHLAARFTGEMDWSVKKLIRAVMLSHAYRLASEYSERNHAVDPDNTLFWRANVRRLEAEALRDSMMFVAGTLKLEPAKGSLVQKLKGGEIGKSGGGPSVASFAHRSVYLPILRNYLPEFLQVFDFAEPASVIGRRDITTVSTQALYLLNDKFVIDQSHAAATRLLKDDRLDGRDERIAGAYLLAYGRTPSGGELAQARRYLNHASGTGQLPEQALGGLIQALFASAEFRYAL